MSEVAGAELIDREETEALRSALRDVFEREWPATVARAHRYGVDPGVDDLVRALAAVGVLGIPFDADVGGAGLGPAPLRDVFELAGRALCPAIVAQTVGFGLAVDRLGTEAQRHEWLPRLCAGELRGTTALWSLDDSHDLSTSVRARRDGSGWILDGAVRAAVAVADSDLVAVLAAVENDTPATVGVFVLATAAPGVAVRPLTTMAGSELCRAVFDSARIERDAVLAVASAAELAPMLRSLAGTTALLRSAELVGAAREVLERTVASISTSRQFGRPIASFQSAQHLVADASIGVDAASLAVDQAFALLDRAVEAPRETAIAVLAAGRAATAATWTAHQLQGGTGYALEADLHLWSERVKVAELLGGARDVQLRRIASELGEMRGP